MAKRLSRRNVLQLAGGSAAGAALLRSTPAAAAEPTRQTSVTEPTAATAMSWWPPPRQVWTPLGWKGHLFRFNTFYSGAVVCEPGAVLAGPKPDVLPYQGKNF